MKKFIVFAVVLALLVPSLAMAATEFSLGGFIKMDMMWDSDNGVGKNMNVVPARNNDATRKHGRLNFTAQGSRFNFTIKGPMLWGAQTTGFIEMDFDPTDAPIANTSFTASNSYTPRLRHAMFRFNWPTSELLMGLYWSMFCEYYAESAEDGPLQMTGTPTHRLAQVRFTQKFLEDWTVAGLIGNPSEARLTTDTTTAYGNALAVGAATSAPNNGQLAETPQVQGKIQYAHDFWGKAAYYGKPTPFTIQFTGGWQRNVIHTNAYAIQAFGENNPAAAVNVNIRNQYLNPWMMMGSLFIPVIPTASANLAGTASILTQWWIGQGAEAFGFSGIGGNKYLFNNNYFNQLTYDANLLNKFGGFVQGQYYFNNQWYMNALYAFSKVYSFDRSLFIRGGLRNPLPVGNYSTGYAGDNASTIQQVDLTLWYRPIQAIKFGLQYSYMATTFLQMTTVPAATANTTRFGNNHRVEFVGYFYF